jgi:hypothetical protein
MAHPWQICYVQSALLNSVQEVSSYVKFPTRSDMKVPGKGKLTVQEPGNM